MSTNTNPETITTAAVSSVDATQKRPVGSVTNAAHDFSPAGKSESEKFSDLKLTSGVVSDLFGRKLSDSAADFNKFFVELDPAAKAEELATRTYLFAAAANESNARYVFGFYLTKYYAWSKELAKRTPQHEAPFAKVCRILLIEPRHGYNLRKDYEAAKDVPAYLRLAGMRAGVDICEKKHRKLIAELKKAPLESPDSGTEVALADKAFKDALTSCKKAKAKSKAEKKVRTEETKLLESTLSIFKGSTFKFVSEAFGRVLEILDHSKSSDGIIRRPDKKPNPEEQTA